MPPPPPPQRTRDLLVSWKPNQRHFFSHPPSPFPGIFFNCDIGSLWIFNCDIGSLWIALWFNSRLNFRCYTQREPTPTQKSARKWQLRPFTTPCAEDYEGHSLVQTSFTEPPSRSSFGRMVQSVRGFGLAVRLVSRRPSARFRKREEYYIPIATLSPPEWFLH